MTDAVARILSYYESDNSGAKTNLARILRHGRLGSTGHLVILPVDQGMEHGPDRSFLPNPAGYDPHYHFKLAIDAGLSAFAAPLGLIESGSSTFAGQVPLILKLNGANSLMPRALPKDQAITASVRDALRLGCTAVGLTIYPGSPSSINMIEEARELIAEAKSFGLPAVVWSYPRDGDLTTAGETAVDVCAYSVHIAALIGAHIIKVKLPAEQVEQDGLSQLYSKHDIKLTSLADRVRHVMKSGFDGKRIVIFSGGGHKDEQSIFDEVEAIRDGGGYGSIIGRNTFQRPREEALKLLDGVISRYAAGRLVHIAARS
jgi:class I fructose-bisphosphate aldolase